MFSIFAVPDNGKKLNLKNHKTMKAISTSNSELLEVLEANGVNIICNAEMQMTISDEDAARIPAIIDELAPAAAYDYTIENL